MSLLGKCALAMVIPAAGALLAVGAGTAQAAGNLYGAIAVAPGTFQVGTATDHPTQAAADAAALAACGNSVCKVELQIKNSCGAAVQSDTRGLWFSFPTFKYGTGATAAEAEEMAFRQVPAITPWAQALSLSYGSSMRMEPFVRATVCTSNAG
ncbi:DUF4189 domain-containing protein [Nocardia sp. NPDC127526]|uniref:DUF4189 domain-containing protein n=1 Tax=Nocardia sp. NPDC127526 TaxID=3345393 RepID=UPI00363012D7